MKNNKILKNTFVDFTQMYEFSKNPLIFSKANGINLWDINNKIYIDAIGGIFVTILGHNYKPINQIICEQLSKISFSPPLHGISDVGLKFIDDFSKITPKNLNFIKAFSGGSEANESAIKFSRQYHKQSKNPGKYKTLSLYQSYHGGSLATSSASGVGKRKVKFEPLMSGFIKVPSPYQIYKRTKNWREANELSIMIIEDIIINEDPDTISSFILEPICNTAGIVEPSNHFFKEIRKLCTKYNIILILDEILCGIAKTGKMFAFEYHDIIPDIICAGKSLSNGAIPIGVMAVNNNISDYFWGPDSENINFAHGHTFAGNPLASVVCSKVIDEISNKNLLQKANDNGLYLRSKLDKLLKYDFIIEIRGRGSLLGVEISNEYFIKKYKNFKNFGFYFKQTSIKNGLILRVDPNWFAISPPLIANKSQLDEIISLIDNSINDVFKLIK